MVNQKIKKLINFNGLARKLLKCKSNPHKNSVNYEYFDYKKNIVEDVSFEKPTSSTMIGNNYDYLVNSTEISSKHSICCSQECHSFNDNEMEQSRKETSFISTIQKDGTLLFQPVSSTINDDYEDITLINKNNLSSKTTSPLSQYKSFNYGCQNTSNNSNNYEYLHSTKINNQDSSDLVHLLQPNNSESFNLSTNSSSSSSASSSNTTNLSLISSPISTSTSFSSKTESNNRKLNLNSIDSTYIYNNNVNNCYNTLNDESQFESNELKMINDEIKNCESLLLNLTSNLNESNSSSSSNDLYVCTCDYQGTFVEDLSVQFADTIKILRDNKDEWLYVESSQGGRKGYIPRDIAIDFNQFIYQLKSHQAELINQLKSN
jgi:hypothetical protein